MSASHGDGLLHRGLAVRPLPALLAVLIAATALLLGGGRPTAAREAAAVSPASRLVELINHERTSRGIDPLAVHQELTRIATAHSADMAATADADGVCNDGDGLHHRSPLSEGIDADWKALAENVAYRCPADPDIVHQMLMDSPGHRANILDVDMRFLGVGAVVDADGGLWVTEIFMDADAGEADPPLCP